MIFCFKVGQSRIKLEVKDFTFSALLFTDREFIVKLIRVKLRLKETKHALGGNKNNYIAQNSCLNFVLFCAPSNNFTCFLYTLTKMMAAETKIFQTFTIVKAKKNRELPTLGWNMWVRHFYRITASKEYLNIVVVSFSCIFLTAEKWSLAVAYEKICLFLWQQDILHHRCVTIRHATWLKWRRRCSQAL